MINALIVLAAVIISGPITAEVVSVYDGDTFTVNSYPWPGMIIRVSVRVNGIDTPEIRGKCLAEKTLAIKARNRAKELLSDEVYLVDIKRGKYAGRIVADVYLKSGKNLAEVLIKEELGREYDGKKRKSWC